MQLSPTTTSAEISLHDPFKVELLNISCTVIKSSSGRESPSQPHLDADVILWKERLTHPYFTKSLK